MRESKTGRVETDALVYELYVLTEEEVGVVESLTSFAET